MVLSPKGEDKYEMKYVPEDFDRYDQGFFGRAKPEYIIVKGECLEKLKQQGYEMDCWQKGIPLAINNKHPDSIKLKKTAEVKQKIAEIESLITEKQETLDMQKDLFLDAKQEQLTKLSKLDEFDEEVIRYLIDYVLVYDNEHIEIRWNFDDFQAG